MIKEKIVITKSIKLSREEVKALIEKEFNIKIDKFKLSSVGLSGVLK